MFLWNFVCSVLLCYLWEKVQLRDSLGRFFSHRAHRVHWAFWRTFRSHRRPPAYRVHRALLLKVAVRFCEIGWLNVSVHLCVFCSSVYSVRNRTHPLYEITHKQLAGEFFLSRRVFFSLTERTEFTEHFCAQFRAHRTPPAYRVHRALLLMKIP